MKDTQDMLPADTARQGVPRGSRTSGQRKSRGLFRDHCNTYISVVFTNTDVIAKFAETSH